MTPETISDQKFVKQTFTGIKLPAKEYDTCVFRECDFADADLSGILFLECRFEQCNMSMAKVINTTFQDVVFKGCKLLGMDFSNCNDLTFGAAFEDSKLDLVSFFRRRMMKFSFSGCSLREVNFTEANLSGAVFSSCDLSRAIFHRTNLVGADFRTAVNYRLDPEQNMIRKAAFGFPGVLALLEKYDIIV
jgi:uncharacterized protein YjbI with pentapeptide repeats